MSHITNTSTHTSHHIDGRCESDVNEAQGEGGLVWSQPGGPTHSEPENSERITFQSRQLCLRQCRARQEFLAGGAHGLILGQTPQPGGGGQGLKRGATSTFSKVEKEHHLVGLDQPQNRRIPGATGDI